MSRVFIAVDRLLGRKVVVKVLPPELAAGVNRDRFRREIQVAAQLQHPHIVTLLSAGEEGDLLWYTMPYIEGESLRAALERKEAEAEREGHLARIRDYSRALAVKQEELEAANCRLQALATIDHLTGLEFTEFVGRMYGLDRTVARERSRELLALFELDGEPGKLIGDYSKGMRKRVAMAAALIHRPELFLLDEPFEGVDAVGARLMKDILLDQVRRGATMFLTSHVLEVVERLCDRIAIINNGTIVASGTLEELRAGGESLEDAFVRVLGAERQLERLDWL